MASVFYLVSGSAGFSSSLTLPIQTMLTDRAPIAGGTSSTDLGAGGLNNLIATITSGSRPLAWVTPPVAYTFTLSGSVTCSVWGLESNNNDNTTMAFRIWHKSGSASLNDASGAETNMMTAISASATEFATTTAARFAQSAITNTVFNKGDRILLRLYVNSGSGATFGAMTAGTTTFLYGGTISGSSGDSILRFSQDIPMKKKVITHDV